MTVEELIKVLENVLFEAGELYDSDLYDSEYSKGWGDALEWVVNYIEIAGLK